MLIVKKFGGSSVADKERIMNVAARCIEDYRDGNQVVVVLSAMGKTTDELIAKAHDINPKASKRELDMLMVTGEQVSVALMAMAMHGMGVPAVSLNAFQVQMKTSSAYGNSKLKGIDSERIMHELEAGKIVIVTGFQGVNRYDDYTTLGRGGSDTTAAALAAALHADKCEIYTDVDGVYTADPRIVPNARKLTEITYDEMLEFASLGAKVLHNRSVELSKRYGVELVVRSSLTREEGTIVKERSDMMEGMIISGVAADKNVAMVSVMRVKDEPGVAFRIFNTLAQKKISVDIILQSIGRDGTKDILFTVAKTDLDETISALEAAKSVIGAKKITGDEHIAKVSIVGTGMETHTDTAARMFEALYNAGINVRMIDTAEIRMTVIIDEEYADRALRVVHDAFNLGNE
ncbi:MAG: aspartate kinase [Lachnospiraceae bacterium]|nr:aspartate kinase [Lachnospiraceae bacterium]